MNDIDKTPDAGGGLNKGQGLVAAFRAARISQRPALKSELRTGRAALRQDRLNRLGNPEHMPAAGAKLQDGTGDDAGAAAARPEPAPAPATGASVFATFLDRSEALTDAVPDTVSGVPPDAVPGTVPEAVIEAVQEQPPPPTLEAPSGPAVVAADTAAAPEAARAPLIPLSSIGFGPGMMIRMSHLGIESVQELAAADPAWLRGALGEISRLINVELWIESARNACSRAA